jgi:arylsulfatase B
MISGYGLTHKVMNSIAHISFIFSSYFCSIVLPNQTESGITQMNNKGIAGYVSQSKARFIPGLLGMCFVASQAVAAVETDGTANVLLIIADDLGVDNVSIYAEQPISTAQTPNIDELAQSGVFFRNAWTNPKCSPSRASIYTGRHAFRHGVTAPGSNGTLAADEETIAEVLSETGYSTALFGKWHLGTPDAFMPTEQGFEVFSGSTANLNTYYGWKKTQSVGGGSSESTTEPEYATTTNVTEALDWIAGEVVKPWFVTLAFNAPHPPFQVPPKTLFDNTLSDPATGLESERLLGLAGDSCGRGAVDSSADCYRAMVEAMDTEIDRLLTGLKVMGDYDNTLIIFVGDNGTPGGVVINEAGTAFSSTHAKGTVYEGGVNVPMIISGGQNIGIDLEGFAATEQTDKVMSLDIFATILAVAGAVPQSGNATDSISLLDYLDDNATNPVARETVYTELFGSGDDRWAVSNGLLKFISNEGSQECYNLVNNPGETRNVIQRSGRRSWSTVCLSLAELRPCASMEICPGD